ncbi:MAG: antibiotic biosynthesis monooxygenase [bacterium]|nr:antibiotic biosynthesis monooxygenase [bacterium]
MTNEVSWQAELAVKPGKLENFRALTSEMVESTRGEPGVLIYERFVSDDGKVVYVYERYADSSCAVSHLLAFGEKYSQRFMGMVERKRFTVFGVPSDELKGILDEFDATYHTPFDGFSTATKGGEACVRSSVGKREVGDNQAG